MKIKKWTFIIVILMLLSTITFNSCEDYIDIDEYVYDKATIDTTKDILGDDARSHYKYDIGIQLF